MYYFVKLIITPGPRYETETLGQAVGKAQPSCVETNKVYFFRNFAMARWFITSRFSFYQKVRGSNSAEGSRKQCTFLKLPI